jgi:hypothetical protein
MLRSSYTTFRIKMESPIKPSAPNAQQLRALHNVAGQQIRSFPESYRDSVRFTVNIECELECNLYALMICEAEHRLAR